MTTRRCGTRYLVLLEASGHRVRSFGLAREFFDAAPILSIGCLIVDIRMPEMDGLELQRHLNERSLRFPMIVITGHGDVPLAVRAMKAGALDFIEKPFSSQTILDSVEAALANWIQGVTATPQRRQKSTGSPRANERCWKGCSPGFLINRSLTIWRSAREPWRSTAPG